MKAHAPLTLHIVLPIALSIASLAGAAAQAQEAPPRPGATRTPSEEIKLLPAEEAAKLQPKREVQGRLAQPDNPLDPNRPSTSDKEPAKVKPAEHGVIPAENEKKVLSRAERKARDDAKDAKSRQSGKETAKIRPAESAGVPAENTDKDKAKDKAKDKDKTKDKQASDTAPARRAVPMIVDRMSSVQAPSYGPTLSTQPMPTATMPTTSVAPVAPPRAAVPRGPAIVNSCDTTGCTDTNGVRYNGTAGTTLIGPGGKPCAHNGVTLQC